MFTDNPKLKNIFLLGFLLSINVALTTYINSSFLSSFAGEKFAGLIFTIGSVASISALLLAPKLLTKIGIYKFLLLISALNALSLLSLALIKSVWGIVPLFILYFSLHVLSIYALDELLKIFSGNSSTGKVRGLYLAVTSFAWVIAQVFSSRILEKISFAGIYAIAFVIMALFFFVSLLKLRNVPDPKYDKVKSIKYIREFFKNKNLARSYKINFLLHIFYCWMVIYTPIYLHAHLGFNWREIGIIFAIMLLPFCIIPFHIGKYSDKIGERKMLMFGFFVASLATLALFFIQKHEVWIWALALFITRIGAATIETMSDVYFFKHIKAENEELIGVYRNTMPVAYIAGPLVALAIFAFVPSFKFIFLVLGSIMLYGVYLSSTIKKSDI